MPNVGVLGAVFFTATALLLSASSVEAQRLAVGYSVFLNPTTLEVVNLGTGVVESREQKSFSGPALFSSDGRFLVLSVFSPTAPSLEVRDLVTGFRTLIQTPLRPLRAHPRRLAVYGLVAGVVTRLDPTGLRPYDACGGAPASTLALTVDGSRLVVSCGSGTIESLDESTGTRLSTFNVGTSPSLGFAINSDGSRALVIRSATSVTELVLYDVASGTEIAAAPMPGGAPPAPFSGPGTGSIWSTVPGGDAVVVSRSWSFDPGPGAPLIHYRRTNLVEFDTLASRTELAVPYGVHSMAISPDGLRAIVASNDIRPGAAIQDLDLRTGQPAVQVNISIGFASVGGVFPPLPPTVPPATVNGQRVTISWSLPAHSPPADRFVIHAGSRSGASDLGTVDLGGSATSFTAAGVPPGRYFIRMTAVNFTGTSSPSAEVIVDVPSQ